MNLQNHRITYTLELERDVERAGRFIAMIGAALGVETVGGWPDPDQAGYAEEDIINAIEALKEKAK